MQCRRDYTEEERNDPSLRPFIEPYLDKNSYVGVLRLKRDIGKESSIGLVATTYDFIERHNDLLSFDGRFKLDPKTTLTVQGVGTTSRGYFYDPVERQDKYRTGNGIGYYAGYDYSDRNFGYVLSAVGRTKDYRADVGFTRRTDTNHYESFFRWSSDPNTDRDYLGYRAINISWASHDGQGRMQDWGEEFQWRWNFKSNTFVAVGGLLGYEQIFEDEFRQYLPASYPSGFAGMDPNRETYRKQIYGYAGSTPSQKLDFFAFVGYTRGIFDFDFGAGPDYPRVSPAATPLSPNSTFSTSGVSGTIVMMMSARCATSLALPQGLPPDAMSSCGTPLRECRKRVWPPLMRLAAMGLPMMPRPMNPILLMYSLRK